MTVRHIQRSFGGGEVSPDMYGRSDDAKYISGLSTCLNFITRPQGPAENRPGLRFVRAVKDSTRKVRLLPFTFSTTQTMVLEFGHEYIRFHTQAATMLPGTPDAYHASATATLTLATTTKASTIKVDMPYTATVTMTIADQCVVGWNNHGLLDNDQIRLTTTGALPTGLTAGVLYYVRYPAASTFYLSDTKDGSYLATSGTQSGTHTGTKTTPVAGTITWEKHALPTGTPVKFTTTGTLPTGLTAGTTYYVVDVTPDTFRVAATVGGTAIATTGAQVGTHTCTATLPAPVQVGLTAHGLAAGTAVALTTTGALPTGLVAGATYYVSAPTDDAFKLADAPNGTELTASGTQSGTHTLHRAYQVGDQVAYSSRHYYCTAASQGHLPTDTAYWSIQPTDVYEIPTAYQEADLADLHTVQSNDVLTIVHPNYHPQELRRLGASDWALVDTVFGATLEPPAGVAVGVRDCTETRYTNIYCVTATVDDANHESAASAEVEVKSNLFETGCTNVIQWQAITGATGYRVYKQSGGMFGLIGSTTTELRIVDDNITPDLSVTPPRYDDTLAGSATDYPGAVSYFEQRRVFAGTTAKPQNIWMTKSGTESDMSYALPVRDDDRVAFRVAAREANTIRHVVPLTQLLLLTSGGEWRVSSGSTDVLTPTSINVRPQSYIGASNVQPCIVNNACIYGAARGGHVHELTYNWQADGFITGDLSLRAAHLFDGYQITDMAFAKAPQPIVWCVSSSGQLYGLTYLPDQQIGGWHRHATDGVFEACCVVAEGESDALYVVVRRIIDGETMRYIERLDPRRDDDLAEAYFVDCGLTYQGVPADTISGLGHLEGKTVSILADGAPHPPRTVQGGAINLDIEASTVHVGLPYRATLATLPLALEVDGAMGQGRPKAITKAWVRVATSSGVFVGPSLTRLTEAKLRTTEPYGVPPSLATGEIELVLTPDWSRDGTIVVSTDYPLPLTVVSLAADVIIGS